MIPSPASFFDLMSQIWHAFQQGTLLPLGNWNYLILFVFVILQGPLVKLLGGAMVARTFMNLSTVILVSIVASLVADAVWFRVGRLGNLHRILRRKSPKQKQVIQKMQTGIRRHYFKILVLGKLSTGMTVPAMLAAGLSKLSWRKWLPAVLLGEIVFTSTVVLLGYFAAESLEQVNQTLKMIGVGISGLVLLGLVIYLPVTFRKLLDETSQPKELGSTD